LKKKSLSNIDRSKFGTSSIKKKNPYLKKNGSFDLIEEFPTYKDRTKDKKKRVINYDKS